MNHKERTLSEPTLTREQAQAVLSPRLTVKKQQGLALIPHRRPGRNAVLGILLRRRGQ